MIKFLPFLLLWLQCAAATAMELTAWQAALTKNIPPRAPSAMTGSEFGKHVSGMDERQREQAILTQLLKGNLPDFLRKLKPVRLQVKSTEKKTITATIFVMPDYLAIGSNDDFLRLPMNLYTATEIARQFGFILPTRKIVDAIYDQSAHHLTPEPMAPCSEMRSTPYYLTHNQKIKEQCQVLSVPLGELVSGHKKDVVITNRLARKDGKIAIYGWHRPTGIPIQPLSTVHGAGYADYSHGIRLVSDTVLIDGEACSIYEVLQDPKRAMVLSEEGMIHNLAQFTGDHPIWQSSLSVSLARLEK